MREPDKPQTEGDGEEPAGPVTALRSPSPSEAFPLLLLSLLELSALSVAVTYQQSLVVMLLIHLVAIACLIVMVLNATSRGGDTVIVALALITGIATGPAGTLGAGLMALARRGTWRPSRLIGLWYERIALSTAIDPDTRLSEDVGVGRTLGLDATPPESFPALMVDGSLAKRQAILGHVARNFHPDYLSTLKLALESPEPVLRVQAAAVASHVIPQVRACLLRCLAEAEKDGGSGDRLDIINELEHLIASGLLDQSEENRAKRAAGGLAEGIMAGLAKQPLAFPLHSDATLAAQRHATLERLLLARERYADLRVHRHIAAIGAHHPTARYRRLRAPGSLGMAP